MLPTRTTSTVHGIEIDVIHDLALRVAAIVELALMSGAQFEGSTVSPQ
jgi:hypothetical protein